MSDFSIKRDWKQINWKATFQYNVFRSVCSIPGWLLLGYLSTKHFQSIVFLFPVAYFAFWLPLGLLCSWLARIGVPFVGLLTIFSSLVIVIGDPIVWLVYKLKPKLVPIENPKFLDFHLIAFVLDNPDAIPPCPYGGRVVSDEHVEFMNEVFPLRKTLFIIKEDWSIETLKDKYFGFVDLTGAIKKGRLQKGIDPRETAIGEIVAYIENGICYDTQKHRIGRYDAEPTMQEQPVVTTDQVCPFAGHVEAIQDETFLNIDWSAQEMIFDIDYRGFVKTPYNDLFGYIAENGDIMKGTDDDSEPTKVASIKGKFCYADNRKIGQLVIQSN